MSRTTKIIGITLYPQQIEYLKELTARGYNRSAIIRKAIELFRELDLNSSSKPEGIQNE